MTNTKIGFIGIGKMGSILMDGFLNSGLVSKNNVLAYDSDQKKNKSASKKGIKIALNNSQLVSNSDLIFLAVKPQVMQTVLDEISNVSQGKLFVSIAAGVSIKKIEKKLKGRVIRVMPNTLCAIQQGVSAYSLGKKATKKDDQQVERLLKTLGTTIKVNEKQLDAVTGLSGSGPAYIYYIIKSLAEAGKEEGLSEETALKLAAQTAKGAAEMIQKTGKKPHQLIEDVCSPGGTTIEGLKKLEEGKVREALKKAVKAAAKRSRQLSR